MNYKHVFLIGAVGGLVGYACGAAFTPSKAIAQPITPEEDAGSGPAAGGTGGGANTAGAGGGSSTGAGSVPQPACLQWEAMVGTSLWIQSGAVAQPEGWEPFAYDNGQNKIILRRCVR